MEAILDVAPGSDGFKNGTEGVCGVLIGKTLEIAGNISFSCRSIDFMEEAYGMPDL